MIKPEFLKRSNIPDFLGDFDSLLLSALRKKGSEFDYIDSWKSGKDEGFGLGTETAIKSFISSGDNQIFLDKSGKIIPFGDIRNELLKTEEVKPLIQDFLNRELNEKKDELYNFVQSKKTTNETLTDTEIINNYFDNKKIEIHDIFKDNRKKNFDYNQEIPKKYLDTINEDIIKMHNKINMNNQINNSPIKKQSPGKNSKK